MKLEECLEQIRPLDGEACLACEKRWDSIAKPLKSLGKLYVRFTREKAFLQCWLLWEQKRRMP